MEDNSLVSQNATDTSLTLQKVLVEGDLSKLTPAQQTSHLKAVCDSLGLNILTRPFEYMKLNGRLTLYAKRDATDQLRRIHKVSLKITSRELVDDIYVVTASASMPDGRIDEATGAVPLTNLRGDGKANAMMKAETKAKRRVTLSICGLGFLDESEVDSIPPETRAIEQERSDNDPGEYVVQIGKKYRGIKLKDIPPTDIQSFMNWLLDQSAQKNEPLVGIAVKFVDNAKIYLNSLSRKNESSFAEAPLFEGDKPNG